MTDEDFAHWEETSGETDNEGLPLERVSAVFQPCILKGSITLAATCNEKCRYVQYESMTITADGDVTFLSHSIGTTPWHDTQHQMLEYSHADGERSINL